MTDELQRIARDFRDLAARFRDAAGDERRTREAAAIAARLFHAARPDVPAFRDLIEWRPDRTVSWSGTDARAEARWVGDWKAIVQALAVHHPHRLRPIMPGPDYYPTACDLLADHAEDAYRPAMVERAQAGVADSPPVDAHAGELGTTASNEPDDAPPALTECQAYVLRTMARFNGSLLLSARAIIDEMESTKRLSEETVRQCVTRLIEGELAERPEGRRSGARLNNAGRRLAGKIAD